MVLTVVTMAGVVSPGTHLQHPVAASTTSTVPVLHAHVVCVESQVSQVEHFATYTANVLLLKSVDK